MKIIIWAAVVFAVLLGGYYLIFAKKAGGDKNLQPTLEQKDTEIIKVALATAKGNIDLELYPQAAPKTVANFIKLSRDGFYNGTKFHRVIKEFMIQGGDPLSKTGSPMVGTGGPSYRFEDEINPKSLGLSDDQISVLEAQGYKYNYILKSLPVDAEALAMANSGPNTNGSQFFIVTYSPQPHLNGKHTVFGKVADEASMAVVRKIEQGDIIKSIQVSQ